MRQMKMRDNFNEYIATEIQSMLRDVETVCPKDSPKFNGVAIAWITENAAKFRKVWDRKHHRQDDYVGTC